MSTDLLEKLPACPKCNGPCVSSWRHPDIGPETAKARELACLACGERFRAPAMACHSVDDLLGDVNEPELVALGQHWRERVAQDREKYQRAMGGKW